MQGAAPGVRLSVVIACWNGPQALAACLASLNAASQVGVEVICVANFDAGAVVAQFPECHFLPQPLGTPVPQLRTAGILASRGAIVALAEDHCLFGARWAEAVLGAHAAGDKQVVGGAVEPAAEGSSVDWAVYFYDYGRFLAEPGQPARPIDALPGNSATYQREALRQVEPSFAEGFFEPFTHGEIQRRGHVLWWDPQIAVLHAKSYQLGAACLQCYHLARGYAGKRMAGQAWVKRLALGVGACALPVVLTARVWQRVWPKGRYRAQLITAMPFVLLMMLSWAAGEGAGYLMGEGRSGAEWK